MKGLTKEYFRIKKKFFPSIDIIKEWAEFKYVNLIRKVNNEQNTTVTYIPEDTFYHYKMPTFHIEYLRLHKGYVVARAVESIIPELEKMFNIKLEMTDEDEKLVVQLGHLCFYYDDRDTDKKRLDEYYIAYDSLMRKAIEESYVYYEYPKDIIRGRFYSPIPSKEAAI